MSMGEVQEEYYKTMDAMEQVEALLAKNGPEMSVADINTRAKGTKSKVGASASSDDPAAKSVTTQLVPSGYDSKGNSKVSASKQLKQKVPSVFDCVDKKYQCLVERLPHVSCYSITLTRRGKTTISGSLSDRLRLSIATDVKGKSTKVLLSLAPVVDNVRKSDTQETLLSASLPGQILPKAPGVRLSVDDSDGSISMRLPYSPDLAVSNEDQNELNTKASVDERWANLDDGGDLVAVTFTVSDAKDLANISCRSCGHRLLARDANIDGVFPLPVGCWDEVADYLTCYEGVRTVNAGLRKLS